MLLVAVLVWAVVPASARAGESEELAAGASPEATATAPAASVDSSTRVAEWAAAPLTPDPLIAPSADASSGKPLKIGVSVDHSVGSGTFVRSNYAYVAARLSVSPSYAFALRGVKLSASANLIGSYEYTPPDNLAGRHYGWDDIRLGLSAPSFFTEERLTGIAFDANLAATLPISLESRWANVITGVSGGLSLSRKIGKFTLGGRVGASKTLYSSLERRLPPLMANRRDALGNLLFLCSSINSNPSGCVIPESGTDGVPSLFAFSGGVNARYAPMEKLSFSAGFNMGKTFKYVVGVDDLSTRAVYSNGTPVADAQGQSDQMIGSLGASYQLTDAISVSLEMGTIQPPLTADGRALRFPFFAFLSVENSLTRYSLSFAGSY
jgi:hypothetical protein